MHVRSRVARWGLLVALALGVVLMHHAPGPHVSESPPAHTLAMSAAPITATADDGCECRHAGEHSGAPFSSGHDVLHLCLAILIGFAAFVLMAFRRGPGPTAAGPARSSTPPGMRGRPPIPVARRLAVLCVMRC
ncbi:DUF6153 family protein [Saccharopolyspora sp. NPDC049357]|uniref:DUF6153 family protein n=1 Tax=Saccharopolyspora sp. NPDC049357 TaxID=3154507 RepID=UPI003436BFC2